MLPKAIVVSCGSVIHRVVGPIHEGVLAEHGSHICSLKWVISGDGRRDEGSLCST